MYDTCAVPEINGRLIDAIRAHGAAYPGRTAYVVSGSELQGPHERSDEKFVIVALPDISAGEIEHAAQQIRVEVRASPDGTDVDCLVLANGTVAVSGQVIQAAGAGAGNPLLVAWLFSDSTRFSKYVLSAENVEDMHAAALIAQSQVSRDRPATAEYKEAKAQVIEVFEHVVVAVKPLP